MRPALRLTSLSQLPQTVLLKDVERKHNMPFGRTSSFKVPLPMSVLLSSAGRDKGLCGFIVWY